MADETTTDPILPADDEAHHFAPPVVDPPEPMTAAERLRAFEDEHFGADAVRINDRIERGSGSPFQAADPKVRAKHAAIEKLIEVEQKLADARAALLVAEEQHQAALEAVDKPDEAAK